NGRTTAQQLVDRRNRLWARLGGNTLSGTLIDCPSREGIHHGLGLLQVGRLVVLQLPDITRVTVQAVYRTARAHDFMAQASTDVEAVLVIGVDAVFAWLQMQRLVSGAE